MHEFLYKFLNYRDSHIYDLVVFVVVIKLVKGKRYKWGFLFFVNANENTQSRWSFIKFCGGIVSKILVWMFKVINWKC